MEGHQPSGLVPFVIMYDLWQTLFNDMYNFWLTMFNDVLMADGTRPFVVTIVIIGLVLFLMRVITGSNNESAPDFNIETDDYEDYDEDYD